MNPQHEASDDLSRLEAELTSLEPESLPELLQERIELAMAGRDGPDQADVASPGLKSIGADPAFYKSEPGFRRSRLVRFLLAPSAAAALVVLTLAVLFLRDPSGNGSVDTEEGLGELQIVDMEPDGSFIDPNVATFSPGRTQTILFDIIDDGIVWTSENEAVRQIRYLFVESVSLQNPDGSTLRIDTPIEEVFQEPVETF